MNDKPRFELIDTATLRFSSDSSDADLHELRAVHVASALEGIAELTKDFVDAGAFHSSDGPTDTQVFVRPPREGSFIIEVLVAVKDNWEAVAAVSGVPSITQLIVWSTKSMRADVSDFEYLDNGQVKISWQDSTVDEVSPAVWDELKKKKRRRKKQLRKIMAPLADTRVDTLEVTDTGPGNAIEEPRSIILDSQDYDASHPEEDVTEETNFFESEASMAAIDFDDPTQWKIRVKEGTRKAAVEDSSFLQAVADGLAISRDDVFPVTIREHKVKKNGRTRKTWTVLRVNI